jgi:hypothetical protein
MHFPTPIIKIRKGNRPYIFKETINFSVQTHWTLEQPFVSQWLDISTSGMLTVKANERGYSWDGCTPKFSVLNVLIVGVPDGHVDIRTMKPYTYFASMVHDALYQYLDSVPIAKRDIDLLFLKMLGDFKLRHLYYHAVKWLGGRGVIQHGLPARQN